MIKLEQVSKSFGSLKIFENFTFEFPEEKITAILGPSGCGKTTLLNILAGLTKIDRGNVNTSDNTSYLFQEPRLLPWLNIRDNVALILKDKMSLAEVNRKTWESLKATGLTDYAEYYPSQLSGGMRQRVAMARAFAYDAPLLLMDEPFKSLDLRTQYQLKNDFFDLWQRQPRTVIMVTHDIMEAVLMGDKLVILSDKPIIILNEIEIDCPQSQRMTDEKTLHLEKEILAMILAS